jgi:hypothetical protein
MNYKIYKHMAVYGMYLNVGCHDAMLNSVTALFALKSCWLWRIEYYAMLVKASFGTVSAGTSQEHLDCFGSIWSLSRVWQSFQAHQQKHSFVAFVALKWLMSMFSFTWQANTDFRSLWCSRLRLVCTTFMVTTTSWALHAAATTVPRPLL